MTEKVEGEKNTTTTTWTTWEELVLACAVKRHGFKAWDNVVMEIQTRSSLPIVFTPQICRVKYNELKNQFSDNEPVGDDTEVDDDLVVDEIHIPWIEDLRKLRCAELKQEIAQYDLSIQNLQLKVKRLEEEREQSLKENEKNDDEKKPDLETESKENRSENESPKKVAGPGEKYVSGKYSGDRSVNESNSKPDPVIKPDLENSSCNDSSDTVAKQLATTTTSHKDETKESSDVHSSASLTEKKMKKKRLPAEVVHGGDEPVVVSPATSLKKEVLVKSEPLVRILNMIRSHKHGSMFERRLESQKTEKYKSIVRQHVDLRTVHTRINDGCYSANHNKFYLDLLLVFNNAIVFFPKSSPESVAAHVLRDLVLKELKKFVKDQKPDPTPEPTPTLIQPKPDPERHDSLLTKHKSAVSIVVCRKRSSITAKPSSSNKAEKEKERETPVVIPKPPPVKSSSTNPNEEESSMKMKVKEKPAVTGARSMRRSSNARPNIDNKNQISNQVGNSSTKDINSETASPKLENNNNKKVAIATVKKRSAADFLKRIKNNSPGSTTVAEQPVKKAVEDSNARSRKDNQQKNKKVVVEEQKKDGGTARQRNGGGKKEQESISPSKRGVGRPPKKVAAVPAKRGRESGEAETDSSKRPVKRSRR